jgi:hypothetical protein
MSFSCLYICIYDQVLPAVDNRLCTIQVLGIPTDADVEENLINLLSEGFLIICGQYEKSLS